MDITPLAIAFGEHLVENSAMFDLRFHALAALLLFPLFGCQTDENFRGAANAIEAAQPIKTVAVFRTRCSDVRGNCSEAGSLASIRDAIASELEFRGMRIVYEEELFARARKRTESMGGIELPILGPILASGRTLDGSTFDDIPPQERATLLQLAQVDGVVESRLRLEEGHIDTLSDLRDATLQVRMGLKADGSTTSVHRCSWTYAAGLDGLGQPDQFPDTVKRAVDCALQAKPSKSAF